MRSSMTFLLIQLLLTTMVNLMHILNDIFGKKLPLPCQNHFNHWIPAWGLTGLAACKKKIPPKLSSPFCPCSENVQIIHSPYYQCFLTTFSELHTSNSKLSSTLLTLNQNQYYLLIINTTSCQDVSTAGYKIWQKKKDIFHPERLKKRKHKGKINETVASN